MIIVIVELHSFFHFFMTPISLLLNYYLVTFLNKSSYVKYTMVFCFVRLQKPWREVHQDVHLFCLNCHYRWNVWCTKEMTVCNSLNCEILCGVNFILFQPGGRLYPSQHYSKSFYLLPFCCVVNHSSWIEVIVMHPCLSVENNKIQMWTTRCLIEVLVGGQNHAYVVVEHNLGGQL